MNILHDIDKARITAEKFTAVIEIPMGSRMKYELDKETGMLMLDRILTTSMVYPANYGFIPLTKSEDGDPLDVLVIMNDPVVPLTLIECEPVGLVVMVDNGEMDEKILAVPASKKVVGPKDVSKEMLDTIVHFTKQYKALQKDNKVEVKSVGGKAEAIKVIKDAMKLYESSKKGAAK